MVIDHLPTGVIPPSIPYGDPMGKSCPFLSLFLFFRLQGFFAGCHRISLLDHVMLLLLKGRANNPLLITEDKHVYNIHRLFTCFSVFLCVHG